MYHKDIMDFSIKLASNINDANIPVAAVVAINSSIISYSTNENDFVWYHAELLALKKAQQKLNKKFLVNASIYVTLEPCIFCSGLLNLVRIKNIYFGAYNNFNNGLSYCVKYLYYLKQHTNIIGGLCETKCQRLLSAFFKDKR